MNKFHDKILSYLKTDDITQLVLIRNALVIPEETTNSKIKQYESPTVNFTDLYDFKKVLGTGGFGVVCHVICKRTSKPLALKITLWNLEAPSSAALSL